MMKPFSLLSLFVVLVFALAGCATIRTTAQSTQSAAAPTTAESTPTSVNTDVNSSTPTGMVSLPSDTPSPTITLTPLDTLEPAQAMKTVQPLLKEPMNCAVPCFWGIIPGETHLDEAKIFFSHLGFISREGKDFYSTGYRPDSGGGFSVIFYASDTIVENIVVTPHITEQTKEASPREWIAFSPETLIQQYGKPSRVEFAVGLGPNISITMIMYFDTSDLIAHYSGYNMTPERFCPLIAPFDDVRLWMGPNPPDTSSFETVSLEKATSLTMDQFAQLMDGNPEKACFTLKEEISP